MKASTKRELSARIAYLMGRVRTLEEELYGPVDVMVPYTAPDTIPVGTTIQVRIPKRFRTTP